jgi:hypothetical protein
MDRSCGKSCWRITLSPRQCGKTTMETIEIRGMLMTSNEQKKCAHLPCRCMTQDGDKYCGQSCKEAGSSEVEIACQCDHGSCPLTV